MKRRWRFWIFLGSAAVLAAVVGIAIFLWGRTRNDLDASVEALANVPIGERWAHPEMQKIRELGAKAVPDLRRILRERNSVAIKVLQKAQVKWPTTVNRFVRVDDKHLRDRQSVACVAIEVLGPEGRPAAPELIEILRSGDLTVLNGATGGLYAIGADAGVCEELGNLIEQNSLKEFQHGFAVRYLATVKPPSERTLKVIAQGFTNQSVYVQASSAEAAGILGVRDSRILYGLRYMQTNSTDAIGVTKASLALWKLTHERGSVLEPVLKTLETRLALPLDLDPKPGESGQRVSHGDQLFVDGAEMFRQMKLDGADAEKARRLLERWGAKSGRIFVEMLLLPATFELGLDREECLRICREGLSREEDYYRIQAARLLAMVSERFDLDESLVDGLVNDGDVNVRIYGGKIYWSKHHDPKVVKILAESLDRSKHQSYWFEYTLPVALETLRDIGPPAKGAIPALENASNDQNPKIATLALAALVRIRQ